MSWFKQSETLHSNSPEFGDFIYLEPKLGMDPPFSQAIPLLGIFPKGLKSENYSTICISIFIAAQFIIAKSWNQPRCPSTDEWITKLWEIHTMEFYSTIKKNKIIQFTRKWKDLENIMLSEISQSQKKKGHMFSLICAT